MQSPQIIRPALDWYSLLGLRWVGTLVLGVVSLAGMLGWLPAPEPPRTVAVLGAAVLLNLALHRFGSRVMAGVLVLDTLVLTALLGASGGVSNPFTLLYLIPVIVASLVLSPGWTAILAALTTVAFGSLFLGSHAHHHMSMNQHLLGMMAAYAMVVPLLAGGVLRFRQAIAEAKEQSERGRASVASAERLASLAALAGGAAHELAQPLSNILLVARELEAAAEGETREDLGLIADQVLVARDVLDSLSIDAGRAGAAFRSVELADFVPDALKGLRVGLEVQAGTVALPDRLVAQALRRLAGNARDAGAETVTVRARREQGRVVFEVEDDGEGMPPDVLDRACEPFFSTKPSGKGRGLGLFFVHSLAHQLGGDFRLASSAGRGTTATLVLPVE